MQMAVQPILNHCSDIFLLA